MRLFRKKRYDGYVIDLRKLKRQEEQTADSSLSTSDTGFLSNLADVGTTQTSSLGEIEDKISALSDRIYKLTERLDWLEHKVERLERRERY